MKNIVKYNLFKKFRGGKYLGKNQSRGGHWQYLGKNK